ncbi:hypothetical protein SAMN05444320_11917 [Streptoalloteichus hindustanus]|uniref:Uncharacterized protein n=1 Tax=Streptoalloteichus hindustanus TaxID=2017 RepID=A0A1M5PNZ6_STRHI|nr:hypothetical protein SAMN05444320_11917 [Streptoalloteichus hindustanus]
MTSGSPTSAAVPRTGDNTGHQTGRRLWHTHPEQRKLGSAACDRADGRGRFGPTSAVST